MARQAAHHRAGATYVDLKMRALLTKAWTETTKGFED
jgi:hypothetical protein